MSDQGQPGWWRASDGKWYPPEQAPGAATPPPPQWGPPPTAPPSSGMPTWAKVLVGVVVGFFLLSIVSIVAVSVLGTEATSSFSSTGSAIGGGAPDDDSSSTTADAAEPADVPEGYVLLEGDGVSAAMPEGWTIISAEDMKLSADQLAELFPGVDPAVAKNAGKLFENGAVLVAIDKGGAAFNDNLNVLSLPGEVPLSELKGQVRQQLEGQLGGTVESIEEVDLPAGPALRVEYTGAAGGVEFHGVQLYIPSDGRTFVVTLSSGQPIAEVGDHLADTFRVE